ncbi:hypothetical protein JCM11491_004816 [Sporobolomyces phaffii]
MPKATSSSRKPSAASKSKAKKTPVDDEGDAVIEVEADGKADDVEADEEEDDLDSGVGGNDATVIAETQFESTRNPASTSKGKAAAKKPAAKASTSTSNNNKRKAKDDLARNESAGSDNDEEPVTPREKKLKLQLEAKEKALAAVTGQFKKLSELRHTRAEEAETRLKAIADERQTASANTIAAYKKEADTLRAENASLQTTAYASPRSKAAQAADRRVQELEAQQAEITARVEELEKEAAEREEFWRQKLASELRARETDWSAEKQRLSSDLETAQKDYSEEVAHSKSLQAKLKSIGPASSATSLPAASSSAANPTSTSTSSAKLAQVTEERDLAIQKLQLNEDLTGFMVNSVRGTDETTYVCSLTDCRGTEEKSLNFKLVFYLDSTVGYSPDIDPERDALLSEILPPELQDYARFDAERTGEWFKRLYTAVNKRK